ncbi:MAG: hypothetical protein WKG01_34115 [Kofleriaceae bacterium]
MSPIGHCQVSASGRNRGSAVASLARNSAIAWPSSSWLKSPATIVGSDVSSFAM